jgi:hypothetical protein
MGYSVDLNEKGVLTAYTNQDARSSEDIQADINAIYQNLESKGGTALGVNMMGVLNSARQDAMSSQSSDPNIWEWMAVLHLGGTIVHEAVHAKGAQDEGPSQGMEAKFTQWALPIINEEYRKSLAAGGQEEMFAPISVGSTMRHASANWYKKAQSLNYYAPEIFTPTPMGSDISGRFSGSLTDKGYGPWGMMAQEHQSAPIETKLGRQFMSPLPEGLDQENDSIEEQLRKYTKEDQKINPGATITEMLSEGYDPNRGYKTTEELLNEKRPKPLIIPIDKSASEKTSVLKKEATLFGWMNNLEISDGNTIPGLGDRVMSWDSRDEDFSEDEDWIRKQPRYNPTYDIKGFYYRYIEPRFRPELFDSMISDSYGTHPAKRFASKMEFDSDFVKILAILSKIKRKILSNEMKSTRLVMTEDILPLVDKIFKKTDLTVKMFPLGKQGDGDSIFSVWIVSNTIDEDKIIKGEEFFAGNGNIEVNNDVLEELLGPGAQREKILQGVMESLSKIYENYTFSYSLPDKNNFRFLAGGILVMNLGGINRDHYFKIGGLLADKLNASELKINSKAQMIYFVCGGMPIILTNKK